VRARRFRTPARRNPLRFLFLHSDEANERAEDFGALIALFPVVQTGDGVRVLRHDGTMAKLPGRAAPPNWRPMSPKSKSTLKSAKRRAGLDRLRRVGRAHGHFFPVSVNPCGFCGDYLSSTMGETA
jgi:hypothetical protein